MLCSTKGANPDIDRIRVTNRIGKLNFALRCKACFNNVFGNITAHISCRAINLCWVLAAECTATMTTHAAVGIYNDFSTSKAAIPVRAAFKEDASRVDMAQNNIRWIFFARLTNWDKVKLRFRINQIGSFGLQGWDDQSIENFFTRFIREDFLLLFNLNNTLIMLGGKHNGMNSIWGAIWFVFDGYLTLGIRTNKFKLAACP